jgi:hypothetical protein
MINASVTTRGSLLLCALCGMLGPAILVASFVINAAPPADYTVPQLRDLAIRHRNGIVLGGWPTNGRVHEARVDTVTRGICWWDCLSGHRRGLGLRPTRALLVLLPVV